MSIVGLLSAVGAPALPGARCRGRHRLFDEAAQGEPADTTAQRHAQALRLCERCPALTACRDWLDTLPPRNRPHGVVAGQLRQPRPGRPHLTPKEIVQ